MDLITLQILLMNFLNTLSATSYLFSNLYHLFFSVQSVIKKN